MAVDTWDVVRVPDASRRQAVAVAGVVVVFVVVALVVLSPPGDGGDGGAGPGEGTTDVGDIDPPPGVNESGVHDADALVTAHRESLMASGFSYRFTYRVTERVENGTPGSDIDVTGNVSSTANLSTVRRRTDRTAPVEELVVSWTNGSASGKRTVANGTSYESYVSSPTPRVTLHYVAVNQVSLARWNLSEVRETDGEPRFVFVANGISRLEDERDHDAPRNYTARMVVDGEGRIHRFELDVTTVGVETSQGDGPTKRVVRKRHFVYELTAVGNVSVPPPEWLDEVGRLVADHHRRG